MELRDWRGRAAEVTLCVAIGTAGPGRADEALVADGAAIPPLLTLSDSVLYRAAFAAARVGGWTLALSIAAEGEHPLPAKVLRWLYYREPQTTASFASISAFLDANPHCPYPRALTRNAEWALLKEEAPADLALPWFDRNAPRSGDAMAAYAIALRGAGRGADALSWA